MSRIYIASTIGVTAAQADGTVKGTNVSFWAWADREYKTHDDPLECDVCAALVRNDPSAMTLHARSHSG